MKANEFKKILKPLIKQTIKEVLLEEGILSKIVFEVAQGLQSNIVVEKKQHILKQEDDLLEEQRQERIRRLNETTNLNINAFEGTKAILNSKETSSHSPMADIAPQDPGVDIAGLQKLANGKWKTLMGS